MRGAANFNPEWGYLAPAPSFIRTVRIVVVAAAVGASAGAAVVFSLVDRPAAEESVAARTLAVEPAAAPLAAQAVVQLPAQDERQPQSAALAPATDAAPARVPTAPNGTTLQNTPIKPQLGWPSPAPASARAVRGPLALLPSPGARAATGTNPPRIVN